MATDTDLAGQGPSELDDLVQDAHAQPLPEDTSGETGEGIQSGEEAGAALEANQQPATAQEPAKTQEPPQADHRVPLRELLDERDRRQQFERELAAYREAERKRKEEESKQPPPDMFAEPDAFRASIQDLVAQQARQFEERLIADRVQTSINFAKLQHGETFTKAQAWLRESGNPAMAEEFARSPLGAGEALVQAYRNAEVLREVGTDPGAYRGRVLDEALKDPSFLAKALEAARTAAAGNTQVQQPQNVTRLPSLNRAGTAAPATGGAASMNDDDRLDAAFGGR